MNERQSASEPASDAKPTEAVGGPVFPDSNRPHDLHNVAHAGTLWIGRELAHGGLKAHE